VKKLSAIFIGANLMFSLPVKASYFFNKPRSFDCQSDKRIEGYGKGSRSSVPEYQALILQISDSKVSFSVKKNYIQKNEIRTATLANEKAYVEESNNYLTIQGYKWALAIAPEKERASLYNMNPDIDEVPMFCLSPQ
jgi:hypothetical protein